MTRRIPLAAALLLTLPACTPSASSSSPPSPPPASSPAPTTAISSAPPAPALPEAYDNSDVSGYRSVCRNAPGGGVAYPGAAAYAGPGPHPIAFFGYGEARDWNSGLLASDDDGVIDGWYAKTVPDLQLVACVDARIGKQIRDCGGYFGAKSIKLRLYRGEYTINIYETTTAKAVATGVHLRGDANATCPAAVTNAVPDKNGLVKRITELSGRQVSKALGKYVTTARP